MDLSELWPILKEGEGTHTEFKRDFTKQANDIAKELAALANSGGGVLLLGVEDDGSVKGIPVADRAVERLADIARTCKSISPACNRAVRRDHRGRLGRKKQIRNIVFGSAKQHIPLQAVDALAFESYREFRRRREFPERPARPSCAVLTTHKVMSPEWILHQAEARTFVSSVR